MNKALVKALDARSGELPVRATFVKLRFRKSKALSDLGLFDQKTLGICVEKLMSFFSDIAWIFSAALCLDV